MDIYLNTNIYCRPFDDLKQERIQKEAAAAVRVFLWAQAKLLSIHVSEINLTEIFLIDNMYKRDAVEHLIAAASSAVIKTDQAAIALADEIVKRKILNDYMDSLHLALADGLAADYFLTCDDGILKRGAALAALIKPKILNPVDFVKQLEVRF